MEEQLEEQLPEEREKPLIRPRIFEGAWELADRGHFDAVTIYLDGRVQADLNWHEARKQASAAVDRGFSLVWHMELGLIDKLAQPLTNQGQFLSLALSLEHFRDTLWKEFKEQTLGISLFKGAADFLLGFPWDSHQEHNLKEWLNEVSSLRDMQIDALQRDREGHQLLRLFCRDVAIEYISLLAGRLPDTLTAFIFLDASSMAGSYVQELQFFNPERFDRLQLVVKNASLPYPAIGWGHPTYFGYFGSSPKQLPEQTTCSIGICIPPMQFYAQSHYEGLDAALAKLAEQSMPFKLIAENQLTAQWDGLDYLIYSPSGLSTQGKRKLQGFCAAGGTAVSTGSLIDLAQEITWHDWINFSQARSKM